MSAVQYLHRPSLPSLAYRKSAGHDSSGPAVLFLTGFASDMEGTKASFLAERCEGRGQAFLRFDYSGHGKSEGRFEDGTIGSWMRDALDVIDALTGGPLILVGSSMGGWIALLCALARKDRLAGLIGLAAAPDFTRDIPSRLSDGHKRQLDEQGFFPLPHDYGDNPYCITRALLEDGENHCLLDAPITLDCPVRLIQGMKDPDVPPQTAERIFSALTSRDKKAIFREQGDHRLSSPDDLALLGSLVDELSGRA